MTNEAIAVAPGESTTCLILGSSEEKNLALLKALIRMPSRWIVIGEPTPGVDAFIESIGRKAFECFAGDTQAPTGTNISLFDGRR